MTKVRNTKGSLVLEGWWISVPKRIDIHHILYYTDYKGMSNSINIFTRSIGMPEGTINQAVMTPYAIIATILAVIALVQPWILAVWKNFLSR